MKVDVFSPRKTGMCLFFSFWGCNRFNCPTWVLQAWFLRICVIILYLGVWTLQKKAVCIQNQGHMSSRKPDPRLPPLDVVRRSNPRDPQITSFVEAWGSTGNQTPGFTFPSKTSNPKAAVAKPTQSWIQVTRLGDRWKNPVPQKKHETATEPPENRS